MPIHPILTRFGIRQAKNLYQVVKYQDKIIDRTYRKAGLYNRGVVKGIQHGLAGGQIVGGIASLGLNAPDTPGNEYAIPPVSKKQSKYTTSKSYQTRGRQTRSCRPRRNRYY